MKRACYCINLRRSANVVSAIYDRYLKSTGLTINQYSLLVNIQRLNLCSVSQLATQVNLERTTLVRMLKPLFEKKWIEDLSKNGERNRKIQLTMHGEKILLEAKYYWQLAQNEIEGKIGKQKVEILMDILNELEEMV